MAKINQFAEGIYRISSFAPTPDISFNQFLIDDAIAEFEEKQDV